MNDVIFTNVKAYKAIADESYQAMVRLSEEGRRPKPDGSPGWILLYDPHQKSFKQAMISIVFTGMWLEASMHLLIAKRFGEDVCEEYDRRTYEAKLELLGFNDKALIERIKKFRTSRNSLMHEKAHFDDGEIRIAQKEAQEAQAVLVALHELFSQRVG